MPKLVNVGVKGAVVNRGKVLVLQRTSTITPKVEFWDLPGGRINGDESIFETLDRELHEEILNLRTYRVGKLLHLWRHPKDFPEGHGLVIVCYKVNAELDHVELSEEHSAYRWVSLVEINELKNEEPVLSPNAETVLRLALKR